MKVDIITRHSVPNYGSLLQTYATQKIIENFGQEAEIIDYTRYEERYNNLAKTLVKGKKWDKNIFTRWIYYVIQTPNYTKMYKRFKKYRLNLLKETEIEYGSFEELEKNPPKADVYCSGSDQIWGHIGTSEYDRTYFLDFVKSKKCIAYSSSFGTNKLEKNLDKDINKLLEKYTKILVREDSAKNILESKGVNDVEHVLDPTLLLTRDDWEDLIKKVKNRYKNYVLVYQLHDNKQFDKYAKEFAKKVNKKLLRITPSFYHVMRSGKLIYLPTPNEFLTYFKDAEYILTDSFHATVFSIIFNKRFINILPGKTSTRITSMLKLLNLENRVLKDYNDFSLIGKNINYLKCNEILNAKREESINLFKEAIFGKTNNIDCMNKRTNCCGCRACEKICPKNAINMIENKEGFIEPKIDKEKCINCGICKKICPQLNEIKKEKYEKIQQVYAAKNSNNEERKKSSSGGIFSNIAREIIRNNGVVYGCAFNSELIAQHIRIDNLQQLEDLRGSKYIQSDTLDTYVMAKNDLVENKLVLYTGTPCQIAGLKKFLNKKYNNLITVDIVCHGVPSPKMFNLYKKYLEEKYKSNIKNYNFRSKEKDNWGLNIKVTFDNGKTKYIPAKLDPYYKTFLQGLTYRECCYKCKYANCDRISDITIADYWGIEKEHPSFYDENGVSAIIVNTLKGEEIINSIKNQIEMIKSDINKVKKANGNLIKPTYRSDLRSKAYKNIDNSAFEKMMKHNLKFKIQFLDRIKNLIPKNIKKILKNIVNIFKKL